MVVYCDFRTEKNAHFLVVANGQPQLIAHARPELPTDSPVKAYEGQFDRATQQFVSHNGMKWKI